MPVQRTILELSIESGSDPIRGSLVLEGGPRRPFNGWIELTAAIEAARGDGSATQWSTAENDDDCRQVPR